MRYSRIEQRGLVRGIRHQLDSARASLGALGAAKRLGAVCFRFTVRSRRPDEPVFDQEVSVGLEGVNARLRLWICGVAMEICREGGGGWAERDVNLVRVGSGDYIEMPVIVTRRSRQCGEREGNRRRAQEGLMWWDNLCDDDPERTGPSSRSSTSSSAKPFSTLTAAHGDRQARLPFAACLC